MVHYVMPSGEHRPAVIVRVWDAATGYVNLQVFLDGTNDLVPPQNKEWISRESAERGMAWKTSVLYDDDEKKPHTWHWIERA